MRGPCARFRGATALTSAAEETVSHAEIPEASSEYELTHRAGAHVTAPRRSRLCGAAA